jgi:PAS domain S-box-containing protein
MSGEKGPVIADTWVGDPEICKKAVEHHIVELNALLRNSFDHDKGFNPTELCSIELIGETFALLRQIIEKTNEQPHRSEFVSTEDSTVGSLCGNSLRIEKERLAISLGCITDALFILDENEKIVFLNASAINMCGITVIEAIGKKTDDLISLINEKTQEPCTNFKEQLTQSEGNKEHRCLFNSKKCKDRIVIAKGELLKRSDSEQVIGIMLIIRDVTEKELLEEELLKVRKLESVGLLAGGIAHDFNNILTGIITNLFMARMSVINNEEACQLIADAEKAAFKATRLTKQLLTFSQCGAPVKESLTVGQLIEETVGFSLSGSNVDYKLHFDENLRQIEADKGQIDQVLNNLIVNAAQAMPEGGTIYIYAENLTLKSSAGSNSIITKAGVPLVDGEYVKISVRDEGAGIPKKHLSKIFDPYFSTKAGSTGLGLTTAYSIITKHGGYIEVDSQLGKGTTFSCYLPALIEKDDGEDKNDQIELSDGCGKVLVMDDDVIIRTVVEKLLKKTGYTVECVSNGTDALTAYQDAFEKNEPFEFVIMDLTIPGGMGGKETVIKLKEFDNLAKVVVFSGYSNDPILTHFAEYGFDGVLKKPFSTDELLHLIKNIGKRINSE